MRSAHFVVLVVVLFAGGMARADDNIAVAREHLRRASTLYDLRRYKEAALEYEKAYEAKADPTLLFNIGQAYRLANEPGDAIASYRAYLRNLPEAPNRVEVEVFIEELQKQLEQQKRAQEAKPVDPSPSPPAAPAARPEAPPSEAAIANRKPATAPEGGRTKRIAGITLGVAGVALLATGAVFGALAQSQSDQFTHPANPATDRFDPSLDSRGRAYFIVEVSALAVGGAALVTGVALFVVGRREMHNVALLPAAGPDRVGLALVGRF